MTRTPAFTHPLAVSRAGLFPPAFRPSACSVAVLFAAGALACTSAAWAQVAGTRLPSNTVPILRGVVSGQAVVNPPTPNGAGSLLTIDQSSSRAIIDWRSFNIGSGSEVRFNQPGTTASTLNRIYSGDPTIIQGKLSSYGPIDPLTKLPTAGGQIILINQNGILFDRGAQVNAYSLVASTLNISNDFFARGLLAGDNASSPEAAFAGGYGIKDSDDGRTDPSIHPQGAIRIGAFGPASAAVPSLKSLAGGNILLFAPTIDNKNGLIAAPDGQVILAAGSKVYLSAEQAQAEGVRGFLVEVSADDGDVNLTSLIRNQGQITSDRGNVTLAGLMINQEGRVSASTAMLYNGSVWLKAASKVQPAEARPLEPARAGTVTLGAGSVTETPLDTTDKTTLAESQDYASGVIADDRRGRVRIEGQSIVNQGRIDTPGGVVTLNASSPVTGETGRIYLAEGSSINAAGSWADVAQESNFATFRVTSSELKDAPDQKAGILKGATVTVDLRKASSILDISGYVDGRRRTVAEKATLGGSVELTSSGDIIQRTDAVIDVSGGGYLYSGGAANTTRLLGDDGRLYDIGSAPQQRRYTAQLDKFTRTYSRWGQTEVFDNLLGNLGQTEAAYVEGRAGGSLTVTAPGGVVLDGVLKGGATTGPTQLARAPSGATLTIGAFQSASIAAPVAGVRFTVTGRDHLGPQFDAQAPLPEALANQIELAADTLFPAADESGSNGRFGKVEVNSRGLIDLPSGVGLDVGVGNSLVLRGNQVDIAGSVSAPSGSVVLQTRTLAESEATPQTGRVNVLAGASVSVAGLWLNNDTRDGLPFGPTLPSAAVPAGTTTPRSSLLGGSISVSAGTFDVQPGSTLDVSGGGSINRSGQITGGRAGAIVLAADQNLPQAGFNRAAGDLLGYSTGTGGSLSLTVGQAQIGGEAAVGDEVLRLNPDFFQRGGFSSYSVTGAHGLTVVSGTDVRPKTESWVVSAEDAQRLPTGARLADIATREFLPDHLRPAASVTLSASGSALGDAVLVMQEGASITTDPGGRVTLDAVNGLSVNGRISAQGGAIALTLRGPSATAPVLSLGDEAELLATGAFIAKPSDRGLVQGTLLDGGSVTLSATRGSIDASESSHIDVSGTARSLDFTSADPQSPITSRTVSSNAGTLTVRAQERSSFASQIDGHAGGASSAGGSFAMEFTNRNERLAPGAVSTDRRIIVTQAPATTPAEAGVVDATIDSNRLVSGGFDKLRLQAGGRIEFRGPTTLEAARGVQLDSPEIRVANGARVDVQGASVVLANSFGSVGAPAFEGTTASRNNGAASRPIATLAGTGSLNVEAGTLDLLGDITLNGVSRSTLASTDDLRLSGRSVGDSTSAAGAALTGSLVSAGDIVLKAAQVYPTTQSSFTVAVESRNASGARTPRADGSLSISANNAPAGDVLSANGSLTLRADQIVQAGVVRAPLGHISLDAGSRLDLAASSITSVSANGLTLPYGTTIDQRDWVYTPTNSRPDLNALTAPPAKTVSLLAPSIKIAEGAVIDLSGGGNVQATEFVPGTGGSVDTLLKDNTFAIMPAAKLSSMPVDREVAARKDLGLGLFTARPDALAYDTIHIGAGAVVPEGDYVLLPGRYALLPGAFVVNLQPGSAYANLASGQTASLANGQVVVAGYRKVAGTSVREDATIGVVVRPGSAARAESDYSVSDAAFFAARADTLRLPTPTLPGDGGRLQIVASSGLTLDGQIKTAAASVDDRDATVDIAAPKIAVVDNVNSTAVDSSFLKLDAAKLSQIGGSLLLGGTRTDTADGVRLKATSTEVVFANGTQAVAAPELLVAATDTISVQQGSVLRGAGKPVQAPEQLLADAQGALLRLASGDATEINRGAVSAGSRGTVTIAAGARLEASGSMAIDVAGSVRNDGTLAVANEGALSLAAGSITLGSSDAGASGLVLADTALRGFDALGSLSLKSYGSLDLASGASLGAATLSELVLDTPLIRSATGAAAGGATVTAQNITLRNTGARATTARSGNANLAFSGGSITLAEGNKAIEGFGSVTLQATGDVVVSGVGALVSAANTKVEAARVVGTPGADQALVAGTGVPGAAGFDLVLSRNGSVANAAAPEYGGGGRLGLEGKSVRADTLVSMKSGIVAMTATGTQTTDGVTLGSNAVIDVGAYTRSFADRSETADAGSVTLKAAAGDIVSEQGSKISLTGGASAGNAGRLELAARAVQLGGSIDARAITAAEQGRVAIDVTALSDFSALNGKLEEAGFAASRTLRLREGDIRVAATDTVTAHEIRLEADRGVVDVAGRLDASSVAGGGNIELFAGTGIRLSGQADASGTSVLAGADAALSNGGTFAADVRSGTLVFAPGASIDVRPGAKGKPGQATFTAARTAEGGIDVDLRGTVSTRRAASGVAGEVIVQGRQVVTNVSEATQQNIEQWSSEHAAFMAAVDVNTSTGAIITDGTRHVRGVLELQSAGDFTLATDWDLTTPSWLAGSGTAGKESGTLSVRAAGDIVIQRSLGLPDDRLVDAPTWSIQLAAGADVSAANPLGLKPLSALGSKGNFRMAGADAPVLTEQLDPSGVPFVDPNTGEVGQVQVDQAAKIRTGTGSISIAAGRDFVFETGSFADQDAKRVIYTAGRPSAPLDMSPFVIGIDTPWADGGGNVMIHAQRDAVGRSNQAVNGWLRRPRGSVEESGVGGWFVYRPNFQQNVGALGGGNVSIDAGNDVLNLSAAAPTMGRVVVGASGNTLEVTGGGELSVRAGNRIEGGDYLVARGTGSLRAGSTVGATTPTQIYLMGESDDAGQRNASMTVVGRMGVQLQSVDNPTALALPQAKALGPIQLGLVFDDDGNPFINPDTGTPVYFPVVAQNFAQSNANAAATYYTYAPTTSINVRALSGDATLGGRPLDKPALALASQGGTFSPPPGASAYPGIVNVVAFDGAVKGTSSATAITLYSTPQSSLGLYAATDLTQLNLNVSDRAPSLVAGWDSPAVVPGGLLVVSANTPRTTLAPLAADFRYDIVADTGSITATSLIVPDRSRVQAGLDIVGASLTLQNQNASDVSVVRSLEGDVRPNSVSIAGPGRLLIQAGRNIDAGTNALQALGNTRNSSLNSGASARLTFIAGFKGDVDLSKLGGAFAEFTDLNKRLNDAIALYKLLNDERDPQRVLQATTVAELAQQNPKYQGFVELDKSLPQILSTYQSDLRSGRLPLGPTADSLRAASLYSLLNAEQDEARVRRILAATSLTQLAADADFSARYAEFAALDQQYPTLFADYRVRRGNGFTPTSLLPIVFGAVLDESVAKVFPGAIVTQGNIDSYLTSIQTIGGSGVDLIAPAGDITVGLTTPRIGSEVGVITTGGGDIRSYLSGNFNINQGKVVTAQGGDITIFTSRGNIDAGRGARTSQTSPAPVRVPVVEAGVVVGFISKIPAGFSGSGIQTLSSDPDGQGPLPLANAGAVSLFTPAGYVDAGEAGIVSGGDIVIVAQTVLNAANISASGSSVGVPVAAAGSLASSLATSGTTTTASKAGDDATSTATKAARDAVAAEGLQKPTILTVEVLGFGDKNCKEKDKDCFAK